MTGTTDPGRIRMRAGFGQVALLLAFLLGFSAGLPAAEPPAHPASGPAAAGATPTVQPPANPAPAISLPIELPAALALAEAWLRTHPTALEDQYLASVNLRYDTGRKQSYWMLQWAWRQPRLGMEFGLAVFMDGTVEPRRAGP